MIKIRDESKEDYDAVRIVNDRAFGASEEGRIVDTLRKACPEALSLVAVSEEKVVGHIFFSPVTIDHRDEQVKGMGLAPMAVLPELQNQGIGSMLVREGIRRIKATDCPFIIVLGHEHFYPRFGFERASKYGLESQWDYVPDESFMVMILNRSAMAGVSGVARYRSEFDEAMIEIREEQPEDYDAVRSVNNRVFGRPEEGRMVDKLREVHKETLSLVAVLGKKIVGHISFSPVVIDHEDEHVIGLGVGPVAVLPEFPEQVIGPLLVRDGLKRIKATDCPFIIVIGHDSFYPGLGFERASRYGLTCQWDGVQDEAFMVMILDRSAMAGVSGVAKYGSEFDKVMRKPDTHAGKEK